MYRPFLKRCKGLNLHTDFKTMMGNQIHRLFPERVGWCNDPSAVNDAPRSGAAKLRPASPLQLILSWGKREADITQSEWNRELTFVSGRRDGGFCF
jgi:hypothetical protein